jgi:hypothetical protein
VVDLAVAIGPHARENQARKIIQDVSSKRRQAGNGHDGHVTAENLIQDGRVLEPLDQVVEPHEDGAEHEGEADGVRSDEAFSKFFFLPLLRALLEFWRSR